MVPSLLTCVKTILYFMRDRFGLFNLPFLKSFNSIHQLQVIFSDSMVTTTICAKVYVGIDKGGLPLENIKILHIKVTHIN